MKKLIIIYFLMILSFLSNNAYAQIYYEPIKLNFFSIDQIDSTLFITADKGYIVQFNPNKNELTKIKVFSKSEQTLKIFKIRNIFYIFNKSGQMAFKYDNRDDWTLQDISDIPFLSVEYWNDNFFIRTEKNILRINLDGEIIDLYELNSPDLKSFSEVYAPSYLNSIKIFNDKLYVETDSNKILIFTDELKLIDSIEIAKSETMKNYDSLKYYGSHYRLIKNDEFLFVQIYWVTKTYSGYSVFVKIDKNKELFVDTIVQSQFFLPKVINDSLFKVSFDNTLVDTNKFTFSSRIGTQEFKNLYHTSVYYRLFNDYYIIEKDLYIVGLGGILQKVNLQKKNIEIINEQFWISELYQPIIVDKSNLIFLSGSNLKSMGSYLNLFFYYTKDLIRFSSTMEISNNPKFSEFSQARLLDIEYDQNNSNFISLGKLNSATYIFNSNDSLLYPTVAKFSISRNFDNLKFNLLEQPFSGNEYPKSLFGNINLYQDSYYLRANVDFSNPKLKSYQNFKYFVNYFSYYPLTKKDYTSFTTLNNDYYPIDKYDDSTYVMDFVHLKSFDKFLVHCANTIDSGRSEIKYTDNHGATWNYVYKYEKKDTLLCKYDIFLNDKEYLLLFHYDGSIALTKMYFDIVDLQSYSWKRIRQWDLTKKKTDFTQIGIYSDGSILNFAIGDTLFYIEDLSNTQSWAYRLLPDSGKMYDPMIKFGDKFISNFENQNGKFGLCVISFQDTALLDIKEYSTEKRNYLYSMPPYPIPATNRVQAEIYWDTGLDINNAEIKIYNIYGEEISSKNSIEVIAESSWFGKLVWNCEGNEPGVYIITINYGTEKKAIKIIKN